MAAPEASATIIIRRLRFFLILRTKYPCIKFHPVTFPDLYCCSENSARRIPSPNFCTIQRWMSLTITSPPPSPITPPPSPHPPVAVIGVLLEIRTQRLCPLPQGSRRNHSILTPANDKYRATDALGINLGTAVKKLAHQVTGLRNHAPKNIRMPALRARCQPETAEILLLETEGSAEKNERGIFET